MFLEALIEKIDNIILFENQMYTLAFLGIALIIMSNIILFVSLKNNLNIKIQRSKYIDSMTNYGNLYYFLEEGRKIIDEITDKHYAVIHFTIDYNRQLNNRASEQIGDAICRNMGSVMKQLLTDDEIFAYLGNDEFVVLKEFKHTMVILEFFSQLELELQTRLFKDKIYNKFKARYGICIINDLEEKLLHQVDRARYASKILKEKRNMQHLFFNDTIEQKVMYEAKLESMIGQGLVNHEFEIYLQPKVDMARDMMIGAEALVRWNSELGLIMPDMFIPIFEKNNSICELDMYIFEEVCRIIRGWLDAGIRVVPISVNLSRNNIYDDSFVEILKQVIAKYNVPVNLIEIELTESAFMENQLEIVHIMEKLKKAGFRLSMDDFGSGYSSLNLLAEMPVDVVKIDKGFLRHHDILGKERIVVNNIVKMVNELGLEVICEGVETNEQARFLRSIGCVNAQGYLYSKPIPLKKFERLLSM